MLLTHRAAHLGFFGGEEEAPTGLDVVSHTTPEVPDRAGRAAPRHLPALVPAGWVGRGGRLGLPGRGRYVGKGLPPSFLQWAGSVPPRPTHSSRRVLRPLKLDRCRELGGGGGAAERGGAAAAPPGDGDSQHHGPGTAGEEKGDGARPGPSLLHSHIPRRPPSLPARPRPLRQPGDARPTCGAAPRVRREQSGLPSQATGSDPNCSGESERMEKRRVWAGPSPDAVDMPRRPAAPGHSVVCFPP